MTTRPKLRLGKTLVPGLLAVALFGLMAAVVFNTTFSGSLQGFSGVSSITAEIGYALFDLEALQPTEGPMTNTEPFLVSFLLIAIVLDAALDAALVLAKREDEGQTVAALSSATADAEPGSTQAGTSRGGNLGAATDGGERFRSDSEPSTDDTTGEPADGDARSTDGGESA
ncbi:hypothetical protein EL22_01215 [Halostagnicola sp. A56]|uniref:hypothetical protein n=1 Tax=Halostagnicola sp. A56 TaxID=1495067 RepID=UPI00049FB132|nr:hypothetical protein [Halostagnicola sp. A56]KDE60349.1 hypothetical protein EL22_01215 [Halostagnicola sp. A56]